jgi:hypothetical protein
VAKIRIQAFSDLGILLLLLQTLVTLAAAGGLVTAAAGPLGAAGGVIGAGLSLVGRSV